MSPLALLLALSTQAPAVTNVALLPVVADDADWAASADAALRRALATTDGLAALDADRTIDELRGATELGLDCQPDDDSCYGKLAAALRVDVLVVPTRAQTGELVLHAYDATTGGRLNVVRQQLPPEGPARLSRALTMVELLLVPERQIGRVLVRTAAGARVTLDAGASAEGPMARFDAVVAGPHEVVVELGETRLTHALEVVAGEQSVVDVPIDASPAGETPAQAELDPLLLGGVGVGVVGVLLGVGGGIGASVLAANLEDRCFWASPPSASSARPPAPGSSAGRSPATEGAHRRARAPVSWTLATRHAGSIDARASERVGFPDLRARRAARRAPSRPPATAIAAARPPPTMSLLTSNTKKLIGKKTLMSSASPTETNAAMPTSTLRAPRVSTPDASPTPNIDASIKSTCSFRWNIHDR
jgi:hypothetical protein